VLPNDGLGPNLAIVLRSSERPESAQAFPCRTNQRRSAIHPIEPIPAGTANGGYGADSAVPTSVAERQVSASKAVLCSMI
jgi:hypothetical protein